MRLARRRRLRCAGWLALCLGCTPVERPDPAALPSDECAAPRSAPPLVEITTLRTRDHEVTVYAGDEGLRFTVAQADGALLGRQLSMHEFEQGFPALHQRFDAAFAGDRPWLDASLDASLDLREATDVHGRVGP